MDAHQSRREAAVEHHAHSGLTRMLLSECTPEQAKQLKGLVVASKAAGMSWADLEAAFPLMSVGTMKGWWREARYAPIDPSIEGIVAARQRQAGEIRWMLEQTFERIQKLSEDASREGIETDTDRFTKLARLVETFEKREAALLGLDAPVRMELDQRVKLDWAPELESLVAELAGGGLLQTEAGEILDGEVIDE